MHYERTLASREASVRVSMIALFTRRLTKAELIGQLL